MASGAVRELITKVKFQIDKASLSQANKAAQDVKKNLTSVSDKSLKVGVMAETSKAQSALKDLKRQADKVSATVSKVKVNVDAGNKIQLHGRGGRVSVDAPSVFISANNGQGTNAVVIKGASGTTVV